MDPRVVAVLDVIAPLGSTRVAPTGEVEVSFPTERFPIFEWPHETTPEDAEMRDLAAKIVAAIDAVGRS